MAALAAKALLSWAIYRKGTARRWAARQLDVVLAPYLAGRVRRQR